MSVYHCENLLAKSGWRKNVYVHVNDKGLITAIDQKVPDSAAIELKGYVIPGFQNGHSHSFQYAMAGLAEFLPGQGKHDDFWTWREAMYNLALKISPDQLEAISAMLYAEMLRNGTTHVVEFHYLHHDPSGKPYNNRAEMSERLMNAAKTAGIELTVVPIYYQQGGFGRSAEEKQRRFISKNVHDYLSLVETVHNRCQALGYDLKAGSGIHSLRAATAQDIKEIARKRQPGAFHFHIAEQQKEVEDCKTHLGKRPVEWVLTELNVDKSFCFTHATHMTKEETTGLAKTGATVIICPSTEGNLGDGFFNFMDYRAMGGSYTIGSDSHIGLSPLEELRWLDYVQRLRSEKRNIICTKPLEDSAATILYESWSGGRRTRGDLADEFFTVGISFDCVQLNSDHPVLMGKPEARILGAAVYGGDVTIVQKVIRKGKLVVENGKHIEVDRIRTEYRTAIESLKEGV
jgi:formimidoylglutamate deiminase